MENGNETNRRLTRVEELIEVLTNRHIDFEAEHKRLLTAQVVLQDNMDHLTRAMGNLASAQKQTEGRLGVLIQIMDEWIRRHPN